MKVLVVGSGGREHALAWKLATCPSVEKVYAAPGNPGIRECAECFPVPANDLSGLVELATQLDTDLTVVGPEAPLTAGIVDAFRTKGKHIFGPTAAAARLEGSKQFSKDVMLAAGVPTARHFQADTPEAAFRAIDALGAPVVLKADGLAAGKGVIVAQTKSQARGVAVELLEGKLVGDAGRRLVIEEFLEGEEVSFIVIASGSTVIPLLPSQDHKAIYDGDRGPNTGGMGAYCDSRILSTEATAKILDRIIQPTLQEMDCRGTPFQGFLYAGLMITAEGPKVLEFNVRLGDPEAQPILLRLQSDLAEILLASATETLPQVELEWSPEPAVCVVLASRGYPASSETGQPITGIAEAEQAGAKVFHAGTRLHAGRLETAGGRVLGVTAQGDTLATAISNTYTAVKKIHFDGMQYRSDIGAKGLKRWMDPTP